MFIDKNPNSVNASTCLIQSTNRFNKIPIIIRDNVLKNTTGSFFHRNSEKNKCLKISKFILKQKSKD